jgi:uncharacterized protein (TIGR02001 family)
MTKKLVFATLMAASAGAIAQESAVSVDASLGYTSRYVWRGLTFANESAQGDLSLGYDAGDAGSFSVGVWGQLDLTDDYDEEFNFTEVDIYGGWEKSFDMVTVGAGVINYQFPSLNTDSATTEIYASIGLDTILAPSLTVYYDVDAADGDAIYASFGVGHDFDLDFTTLSISGAIGYVNEDGGAWLYGSDDSGFTDVALSASVSFNLNESISVSPFISYTALIEDAKDAQGGDNEEIFGGVNFSMSF